MFCPICKAEYREGFTHCPDCDADLVSFLPREARERDASKDDSAQSAVVVWQGTDPLLADHILEVLDEEGVESYSEQLLSNAVPVPYGRDDYAIWVHGKEEARARDLIRDYLRSVEEEDREESAPSRESEEGS